MVLFKARDGEIKIGATLASVNTTTALDTQVSSSVTYSGEVRDVSLSGCEADFEEIKFFGLTSGVQNSDIDEGEMSMREMSFTFKYVDEDVAELASATAITVTQ